MRGNEMKKVITIRFAILLFCSVAFIACLMFMPDVWCLLTCNGYEIPKESSLFSFRETQGSCGNGDQWTYGEDDENYYGMNQNPDYKPGDPSYVILEKGKEPLGFDKFDSDTWGLWVPRKKDKWEEGRVEYCKPWRW
jgi:hypothetical protein